MSIVIGLTGQTGAGKSTISEYAQEKGIAVIYADAVAREALSNGSQCLLKLAEAFGNDIICSDGSCNRPLLAKKAFADRKHTDILNSITHPWIIKRTEEYIREFRNKNYDMILFDASQLFESGGDKLCDYIIAVTADEEIRLDRIINRDKIDRECAERRIKAQYDEKYYTEKADAVIDGSAPIMEVRKQVDSIFAMLADKE